MMKMSNGDIIKTNKNVLFNKILSRKFLLTIAGSITPLLLAFGVSTEVSAQIVAIITFGAVIVSYIFVQGQIDFSKSKSEIEQNGDRKDEH